MAGGKFVGTLWIASRRPLQENDSRLLASIADFAAGALKRAALQEPSQRGHVAKNAALREVFAKLQRDGVTGLSLVPEDRLLGDDGEATVDGTHPTDVPEPFASLIRDHLAARPNLRTGAGPDSPWLFPSTLAGRHLHPNTVMDRLRDLGVNLLGARNRAIGELVLECPPSLVAEALGCSAQVAFLHADRAAEPWARYAGRSAFPRYTGA